MGLEKIAEDVLISFLSTAGEVKDFALEQAPLVVQEFITYNIARGVISLVLSIILFIAGGVLLAKLPKNKLEGILPNRQYEGGVPYIICKSALLVVALSLVIGGFESAKWSGGVVLKATLAPRVFILEKVSDLVHKPESSLQEAGKHR